MTESALIVNRDVASREGAEREREGFTTESQRTQRGMKKRRLHTGNEAKARVKCVQNA